mgnify:CR=1 FL=1
MAVNYKVFTLTTIMVAGPTRSGKAELVFRMLGEGGVFDPLPAKIRYQYGAWQNRFENIEAEDRIHRFVEGIPVPNDVPSGERHIDIVMVIDDLKEETSK